jgi:hypothetical protein
MSQLSYMTPGVVGFVDRRTRLLVIGIFLLLAAVICLLLGLLIPLMMYLPQVPGMPPKRAIDLVPGMAMYFGLAAGAIALGIGAIRVRRWIRPLILCLATIWLIAGICGVVMGAISIPQMMSVMQAASAKTGGPGIARGMAIGMAVGSLGFMSVFYILVPALLILAFRGRDVQATLEYFDPHPRWTDGVPLIVLGLSLSCMMGALGALISMPHGLFFFFGTALFGWPGRAILGILCVLLIVMGWLVYRRSMVGWWLMVISSIVLPASWIITLMRVDLTDVYSRMGLSSQQMKIPFNTRPWAIGFSVQTAIFAILVLLIAWKARAHFGRTLDEDRCHSEQSQESGSCEVREEPDSSLRSE